MKKRGKRCLAMALCLGMVLTSVPARAATVGETIGIGLYYGETAMPSANLENEIGSGYYMGYIDEAGAFFSVAYTGKTKISMLKTQNMYLKDGKYSDEKSDGAAVIGCFHLQVGAGYASYEEALTAAAQYPGAFPAWVNGIYSVRMGSYATRAAAEEAKAASPIYVDVAETSAYGINVLETKTDAILFQFDGGERMPFVVQPGLDESVKAATWFKGNRYYGRFRYERRDGNDLTVTNLIEMDDYINCVISQEMSEGWPLEALKAQAVCARTYAESCRSKHKKDGFDLCATVHCQAYPGMGRTGENTAAAALGTSGLHAWYGGELAETVYFSSDGGATENSENVWSKAIPYLRGKTDPYEAAVADKIPNYHWSKSFTKAELAELLRSKGYQCGDIVDFRVSAFSDNGNAHTITFTDSAGKHYSFSKEKAKLLLGLRSMRYSVSGGGQYYVDDGGAALGSMNGAYAIGANGTVAQVGTGSMPYIITAGGTEQLAVAGDSFTVTGTGWGHNVGMSQWGAYAMATQGKSFEEILKFYYTGIELH